MTYVARSRHGTITTESCKKNGAIAMPRMTVSGLVVHVTIYLNVSYCVLSSSMGRVGVRVRIRFSVCYVFLGFFPQQMTMTTESSTDGATTLSRMNVSGYVRHVTIFS